MPQFDFLTFLSQSTGILVSFFVFYFFIVYFYLPNFAEALKFRKKLSLQAKSISASSSTSLFNLYLKEVVVILTK